MRAIVFDGRQLLFDAQRREPELAAGEAIIRPARAGVCATDVEISRGYMGFRGVLGHEFVGVVERVHASADVAGKALVGRRVVGTINCACGRCDMCLSGLGSHCRHRSVLGIQGRDGCFADRFALPLRNLLPVPDALDDDHAVFTEPLAAACQVLRQVHIEGRRFVTVLGDGRLGLLVAQVIARLNNRVRVIGKHPQKLSLCEKWGIRHRLLTETAPRADQDIVIDCTGSPDGLGIAMKMVRPRGTIVLKTTVAADSGPNLAPLVIDEVQLIGSRCGPFPDALARLTAGEVDVLSLISRRMPLSEGAAAIRAAKLPEVIKVLLEY
jgi:alcohol dehydrogenase